VGSCSEPKLSSVETHDSGRDQASWDHAFAGRDVIHVQTDVLGHRSNGSSVRIRQRAGIGHGFRRRDPGGADSLDEQAGGAGKAVESTLALNRATIEDGGILLEDLAGTVE
jgi:hypothetical protein